MNKIIIKGRLTADPELKRTGADVSLCTFNVAVDRNFAKQGEDRKADFFRVTCWRKTAEFVEKYFSKGQEIIVEGAMESNKYKDKDGNDRTSWDLNAERVEFCGSKKAAGEKTENVHEFEEVPLSGDNLPF